MSPVSRHTFGRRSLVEALLINFVPEVGHWLPMGAARALSGSWSAEEGLLPFWSAGLVLTGYTLAMAAAGTNLVTRRERDAHVPPTQLVSDSCQITATNCDERRRRLSKQTARFRGSDHR